MLGLQQDPLAAPNTPFNHDRLVQTPLVGAPGAPAALQDGVSPVDPPNPAGPTGPFIPGGLGLAASANWWHRTLAERLGTVTVGLAGRTEPPFDGFLTRLCTNCEDLVLHEEFFDRIGRIARNAPQSVRKWWEDPFLCTCTCRRKLGAAAYSGEHVLCKEHREQQWKELVQVKNRRDRWLRNVQINLVNGRLQQATVATKRDRVNASGWWRACRCGNEIGHFHGQIARALMCMGCQGHVILRPFPPGPAAPWTPRMYLDRLAAAGNLEVPRRPLRLADP